MTLDVSSITTLLRSFTTNRHLISGQQLHSLLLKSGHLTSLPTSNSLLHFYSRCSPNPSHIVHQLFDEMPTKNPFSYNTLVDSYLSSNLTQDSIALFYASPSKNSYSWTSVVTGLVKCGDLANARKLFDEMPVKDATCLNSLIHGYLRGGRMLEGLVLYRMVQLDDKFVLATVVNGCVGYGVYGFGRQVHGRIVARGVEVDSVLGSALVDMYGKSGDIDSACRVVDLMESVDEFSLSALVSGYSNCGRVEDARRVFDRKRHPGVVLWNSMINGYVLNDRVKEGFGLFSEMREGDVVVDSSTFAILLSACASFALLEMGNAIHACGLKHGVMKGVIVMSALVDCYSKCGEWEDACRAFGEVRVCDTILLNSMINVYSNCGRIEEARMIFDSISNKTLISWNSMVVGYSQNAYCIEALDLFAEMHRLNLKLDKVAIASTISASAGICDLGFGEQVFALATTFGLDFDPVISTSLIDLYCKCGNVADGCRLFNWVTKSDIAIWNTMMMGYASNGYGTEVLKLFEAMKKANMPPNQVTYIAVLSGCCHSGFVEEGLECFYKMKEEYSIDPIVEHYSLVVDLLVRSGRLVDAVKFIDNMPIAADESTWTSMLGACNAHGDEDLGGKMAERLMKLNPGHAGPFVQLSSLYASQGKWDKSERMRQIMRERRVRKNPGYSWIDN